jgi:hypothetical protein
MRFWYFIAIRHPSCRYSVAGASTPRCFCISNFQFGCRIESAFLGPLEETQHGCVALQQHLQHFAAGFGLSE